MDEPCSALDPSPLPRSKIWSPICAAAVTIVIVTHNMQQAARVSQKTGFSIWGGSSRSTTPRPSLLAAASRDRGLHYREIG